MCTKKNNNAQSNRDGICKTLSVIAGFYKRLQNINNDPDALKIKNAALAPLGNILAKLKVHPNTISLLNLLLGFFAAFLVGQGRFLIAGLMLLVAFLADGLDGYVARETKTESVFGAFLDGVSDRYVDTSLLLGLTWYFFLLGNYFYAFLISIAIIGTVVTSYSTPHAISISLAKSKKHIGFFGRFQRITLLIIAFLFPSLVYLASWILAIFANLSALQRIYYYYQLSRTNPQ